MLPIDNSSYIVIETVSRYTLSTMFVYHCSQGRIQDLKLGVAQMDWKIL